MATLQPSSLDWALSHAEAYGDTDVFPLPFEYSAIRHDWSRLRDELARQDVLQWTVRPHRRLLAPKSSHGFRIVTQLDPLDFLLFTSLVYEIGTHLEATRVPVSQNIVFSFRYAPTATGQLFEPNIGYNTFQEHTRLLLERHREITHVVATDIADFYPRIYTHRLENALDATGAPTTHIKAVMRLLNGWNATESYGVPVGTAAARLLAEVTISDVDYALVANNFQFLRYNDDYRMFCTSFDEAYKRLALLADVLFRNHGLTLQPQKTTILSVNKFVDRYLKTYEEREVHALRDQFHRILNDLNLVDPYQVVNYNSLDEKTRHQVNELNLAALFREELARGGNVDASLIKFILRRLGQLGDSAVADEVLNRIDLLHPVFPDIIKYLGGLTGLSSDDKKRIGNRLLDLLSSSVLSSLEYYKMWTLHLFTSDNTWANENRYLTLLFTLPEQACRRELILALGKSNQGHWFQSRWRDLFEEAPWSRRALLAAASCLRGDAREHWYRAIRPRIDTLERAITNWASANPFN